MIVGGLSGLNSVSFLSMRMYVVLGRKKSVFTCLGWATV
jgi:hypothetical protein